MLLKILWILFLCVLGLLVLLLILLAHPVRYRITGACESTEADIGVKVRWFFVTLRGAGSYHKESGLKASLSLFRKDLWSYQKKEDDEAIMEEAEPVKPLSCMYDETEESEVKLSESPKPEETGQEDALEVPPAEEPRLPFMKRLKEKVFAFDRNIRESLQEFYRSVLQTKAEKEAKKAVFEKKKTALLGIWNEETTRKILSKLLLKIKKIISHILPKKGSGTVRFGTGDPGQTAKILEVLALFYPVYGKVFTIYPELDDKCFSGNLNAGGRINLLYLLFLAVTVIVPKRNRNLYSRVKEILDEKE